MRLQAKEIIGLYKSPHEALYNSISLPRRRAGSGVYLTCKRDEGAGNFALRIWFMRSRCLTRVRRTRTLSESQVQTTFGKLPASNT
jgi:hypothetical protein